MSTFQFEVKSPGRWPKLKLGGPAGTHRPWPNLIFYFPTLSLVLWPCLRHIKDGVAVIVYSIGNVLMWFSSHASTDAHSLSWKVLLNNLELAQGYPKQMLRRRIFLDPQNHNDYPGACSCLRSRVANSLSWLDAYILTGRGLSDLVFSIHSSFDWDLTANVPISSLLHLLQAVEPSVKQKFLTN